MKEQEIVKRKLSCTPCACGKTVPADVSVVSDPKRRESLYGSVITCDTVCNRCNHPERFSVLVPHEGRL